MDKYSDRLTSLPILLIVNRDRPQLELNSPILATFSQVWISMPAARDIVVWVQEHQPDLIVLDLSWSEIIESQLISTLRLDWLTRNIPILVITDASELCSVKALNYDACLNKSCSLWELEQTICSLISVPTCKAYNHAV